MAVVHSYTYNGRANITGCPSFTTPPSSVVPYDICRPIGFVYGAEPREFPEENFVTLEHTRQSQNVGLCAGVPLNVKSIHANDTWSIIWMIIAALTIAVAVAVMVIMVIFRETPVVQTSNQWFLYLNLLGIIMIVSVIFPMAVRPNDVTCVVIPFLGGIGFVLAIGPILSKLLRVQLILSNTTLVSIPISTFEMLRITGALLAIELVFLIIWQSVSTLSPGLSAASSGSFTFISVCKCDHEWVFLGIQIGLIAILLLAGCVLAVSTRKVHTKVYFSEPRWLSYAIYFTLMLSVILVFIRAFVRRNPTVLFGLSALVIWAIAFGSLLLLYGIKLFVIFFRPKSNTATSTSGSSAYSTDFKPDDLNNNAL